MIITDIKKQQHRNDRYSIFADGKFLFSFGESALLEIGLHIGQEISPEAAEQLKVSASFDKLYDQTLNYIAIRRRSEWEIEQYLRRKTTVVEDRVAVMKRLREGRWLDDTAFATAWVESRRLLRATNQRRLRQELQAKHVDEVVINTVLAADETDETAVLKDLVARKRRQSRYQDDLKLMQYLVRQGFNYEAVKQAVKFSANDEG